MGCGLARVFVDNTLVGAGTGGGSMKIVVGLSILLLTTTYAAADDFSGIYKLSVKCRGGGGGATLTVSGSGSEFSISGKGGGWGGGSYQGKISGQSFRMTYSNSFNEATFVATKVTPGNLGGVYTQTMDNDTCSWVAKRTSAPAAAAATKPNRKASADEQDNKVCLRELGRYKNDYQPFRVKVKNLCKRSIKVLVTSCDKKLWGGKCRTDKLSVGALSVETFESDRKYPEYVIQ